MGRELAKFEQFVSIKKVKCRLTGNWHAITR